MAARREDRQEFGFLLAMAGVAAIIAGAFGLGWLLDTPPLARFWLDVNGFLAGVAATLPLLGFLYWFSVSTWPPVVGFRRSQVEFLSEIGFEFKPLRIALLSVGAGVSEELLFRGVLQEWSAGFLPLWAAILGTNILFGGLHARTLFYAIIAGLVGAYFGVVFVLTDNLLAPIVAHALYDAVAFLYARRLIGARG